MSFVERYTRYCPPILDGQVDYLNTSSLIRTENGQLLDYPKNINPLNRQGRKFNLTDLRDFGIVCAAGLTAWNYGSLSGNQFRDGNVSASDISLIIAVASTSVGSYFAFKLGSRLGGSSGKPPTT